MDTVLSDLLWHKVTPYLEILSYTASTHLAELSFPLFKLYKKGVYFPWSTACQEAFDIIKQRLTTPPVLRRQLPYILQNTEVYTHPQGAMHQAQTCTNRHKHTPTTKAVV